MPEEQSRVFAEKLDYLFRTVLKPDGSEYTYEEVQEGTNKAITAAYVWRLRTGKALNPGYRVIQALADFFTVDAGFFFQRSAGQESEKPPFDPLIEDIALRSSKLDDTGRRALRDMVEFIGKLREDVEDKE